MKILTWLIHNRSELEGIGTALGVILAWLGTLWRAYRQARAHQSALGAVVTAIEQTPETDKVKQAVEKIQDSELTQQAKESLWAEIKKAGETPKKGS